MPAQLLDGKRIAETLRLETAVEVSAWSAKSGVVPHLTVVLVGEEAASAVYVRNKRIACEKAGIRGSVLTLPATVPQSELLDLIARLNADPDVHGILVQLPLPKHVDPQAILDAVTPLKDVDCFHPENVGLLSQGRPRFLPCTPAGVQQILMRSSIPVAGKHVVVVGRSEIVGKPLALMLMQKQPVDGANATVTVCHSRTEGLAQVTRTADILVAAIGLPEFVKAEMVRPGAVVIDVGINRVAKGLVGDVDFAGVSHVAAAITPVPGGVGPMTIAMLLQNTLRAAQGLHR